MADCVADENTVIKGDSQLVINQIKRNFKVKASTIIPLYRKAMSLIYRFNHIQFEWISRYDNKEADRLSNLAYQEQCLGV
jgi:ribonuclease HI